MPINVANTRILTQQAEDAVRLRHTHPNLERLNEIDAPVATILMLQEETEARMQAVADEAKARIQAIQAEAEARIAAVAAVSDEIAMVDTRLHSAMVDISENSERISTHIYDLDNPHQINLDMLGGASLEQLQAIENMVSAPETVTQQEAEAGTSAVVRSWTALRVRQAVNAVTGAINSLLNAHIGATGNAHGNATATVAGFISATDKAKLDGIQAGATAGSGVPETRTITTTAPITGGGNLTANRTIALSFPNAGATALGVMPWRPNIPVDTDINAVTAPGFHRINAAIVNGPEGVAFNSSSGSGTLMVAGITDARSIQVLFHNSNRVFMRAGAAFAGNASWREIGVNSNPSFESLTSLRQGIWVQTTFPTATQVLTIVRVTNASGLEIARRTTTFTGTASARTVTAFLARTFNMDGISVTTRARTDTTVTTFATMISV